jgi:23S rRNA pseudouridine1911/1915/1917 synthase
LDKLLAVAWGQPRAKIAKAAKRGLITVDGVKVKASLTVKTGQKIEGGKLEEDVAPLTLDPHIKLDILYQDSQILVINKPANLTAHPGPGVKGPTLTPYLLALEPTLATVGDPERPGLVHRLDKDTTGIMVIAKTNASWEFLKKAFSSRKVIKKYLAFTLGVPVTQGLVDQPIGRHPTQRRKMAVIPNGRPAKTLIKVLKVFPPTNLSLVELTLLTGRTHQARVHLAKVKAPVLGDPVYGPKLGPLLASFPSLSPFLGRQLLHARRITIPRAPGGHLALRAPWPLDFQNLYAHLQKLE